jgi:diacylglycerol kinase (ATP)
MDTSNKGDQNKRFSMKARLKSFKHAFYGLRTLVRFEHNARIHLFIIVIVVIAGIFFRVSESDWIAILLVSGLVLISECFNTAVEYLSDQVKKEENENIKNAKDIAAAGVLISAIISVIIGLIVFLPEISRLISC